MFSKSATRRPWWGRIYTVIHEVDLCLLRLQSPTSGVPKRVVCASATTRKRWHASTSVTHSFLLQLVVFPLPYSGNALGTQNSPREGRHHVASAVPLCNHLLRRNFCEVGPGRNHVFSQILLSPTRGGYLGSAFNSVPLRAKSLMTRPGDPQDVPGHFVPATVS